MIRVRFIDGLELEGTDAKDVVFKLHESSFDSDGTVEEYMKRVQDRARIQTGKPIFFSDFESFVNELHRVGLITEMTVS